MTKQLIENDGCMFEDDYVASKGSSNPWFEHQEQQKTDDDDLCQCAVFHDEEEQASNHCSACGKLIIEY